MHYRVLIFSKSKKRTRFARSLRSALRRAGHEVRVVNYPRLRRFFGDSIAHRLTLGIFESFRPNRIFVYSKDVAPRTFEHLAARARAVVFSEDLAVPFDKKLLELARLADLLLMTNRTQTREAQDLGVKRALFIRGAVDLAEHGPYAGTVAAVHRSEVAFIGRPGDENRHALLRRLAARFDLGIYGSNDWQRRAGLASRKGDVLPRDYGKICAGAKVVVGLDVRQNYECYCSNRTWLTLGCRGFLVTSASVGLEEVVRDGEHARLFHSQEECEELIAKSLERPDERRRIADSGHEFVLTNRTFDHFAVELLKVMNGESLPFNVERAYSP